MTHIFDVQLFPAQDTKVVVVGDTHGQLHDIQKMCAICRLADSTLIVKQWPKVYFQCLTSNLLSGFRQQDSPPAKTSLPLMVSGQDISYLLHQAICFYLSRAK